MVPETMFFLCGLFVEQLDSYFLSPKDPIANRKVPCCFVFFGLFFFGSTWLPT